MRWRASIGLLILAVGVLGGYGIRALRPPGARATWVELTELQGGREIFGGALAAGEPLVLVWTNSLFRLQVTERFSVREGRLELEAVTFADPRGLPPPQASGADLDDLYHTGGPFHVEGLARPFTHLVFRLGQIGDPRLELGGRSIRLLQEAEFGTAVALSARPPQPWRGGLRESLAFLGNLFARRARSAAGETRHE
jgi:hypothetical protein